MTDIGSVLDVWHFPVCYLGNGAWVSEKIGVSGVGRRPHGCRVAQ